jgi:hypothetical protein
MTETGRFSRHPPRSRFESHADSDDTDLLADDRCAAGTDVHVMVAALLPLAVITVMFVVFLRLLLGTRARAEESRALSRATVSELRAIRQALEHGGKGAPPGS